MSGALTLEADIAELSPGGDGVAICVIAGERRAVFVPGVIAGERVRVRADFAKRPARGQLLEVLTPSPARVETKCAFVDRCGGCDWSFLAEEEQAREHARIATRLLAGVTDLEARAFPAVKPFGYRTRARVHVVSEKRGRIVVGMFARRSHEPAAVDTCIVLDPVLDRARSDLASWLEGATGRGEAQLGLGLPGEPRRAVLDLRWNGQLPGAVFGRIERAVLDGALAGARIFVGDVRTPATIGDPTPYIVGADGAPLRLAPGGFSQATEDGNRLLANRVAELARGLGSGPCVELFSGAGNLTVLLARDRKEVVSVEQDKAACVAARANLEARSLTARVVEADANTHPIPKGTSLVVLDPPRDGARAACEALAARAAKPKAPAILYVSCDPPTLARDVKTLVAAGYRISVLETFEMFPQTSHVETVVVLEK
jgi:23S rRNA (uracil1939-C5)-methyltransferase